MVYEIAILRVNPEKTQEFEKMYSEVVGVLRRQKGYKRDQLLHAIERPNEYILKVTWEGVESHQAFIDSSEYPLMAEPFGKFVLDTVFAHYAVATES
jgi:heme-degrading monooxygenase HmoA